MRHIVVTSDEEGALVEAEIEARRFTAVVEFESLPGRGPWYDVHVRGHFAGQTASREAAEALLARRVASKRREQPCLNPRGS